MLSKVLAIFACLLAAVLSIATAIPEAGYKGYGHGGGYGHGHHGGYGHGHRSYGGYGHHGGYGYHG